MRPEVRHTVEFDRVAALPRRRLAESDAAAWADVLTRELAIWKGARLRPWQAYALAEICENHGAWLALPVGLGKTLITYLAPILLGAQRPALIIPASLRDKTNADFGSYVGVWRTPSPVPRVISLQELAPEGGATLLETMRPDLILIDEADELANRSSSAARRIDRYIVAHPETIVVPMTGTPSRKSIMGYWHLLCWALRERAPVPLTEGEASQWAAALDEQPARGMRRVAPGPLGTSIESARAWFRQRLSETPGVVIVDGDSAGKVPLSVNVRLAKECRVLDEHYRRFIEEFKTPGDIDISDPLSRWRLDGQLGCGLYLKYDPPPPEAWRMARSAVSAFVRDTIERSTHTARPLDTEAQVLRRYREHEIVQEWLAIRDTFTPNTVAVWLSSATLESAREWLLESDAPAIIWCGGVEFARALSSLTGLPYYGREGKDQRGRGLHTADPRSSLIASWHANKRGFNLQAWRRVLVVHPPQSAKYLEQVFGRHHRAGQTQPVTVDILATSGGILDGFETAVAEAGFAKATVGMTQKLLRAEIVKAEPQITPANAFRWARRLRG